MSSPSAPEPSSSSKYALSGREGQLYYYGVPSIPNLICRTGTAPWVPPRHFAIPRELRPVFDHKIVAVWEPLVEQIIKCLDSNSIRWTSIDGVRFALSEYNTVEAAGPVVLWVGVTPKSISSVDAYDVAMKCLSLVKEFGITDVDVEFRESVILSLAGPKFYKPVNAFAIRHDPTAETHFPLTPVLGLHIASQKTPISEGTGGLYISADASCSRILLVTARHVVFPPTDSMYGPNNNKDYTNTSGDQPDHNIIILGTTALEGLFESIDDKFRAAEYHRKTSERQLGTVLCGENEGERVRLQDQLDSKIKEMDTINSFYDIIKRDWGSASHRIIGRVVRSSPLAFEPFTLDWAAIEIDRSRFDPAIHKLNVIDLHSRKFSEYEFCSMMDPKHKYSPKFDYPRDRLFKVQPEVIPMDELLRPDTVNEHDESCKFVIKRGKGTGVTIGRANGVFSYVRTYLADGSYQTSKEWAILPYSEKAGDFSTVGDSGSVVVDARGRIGGLITRGSSADHPGMFAAGQWYKRDNIDIAYATPFTWLFEQIKASGFPNAHLNPTLA